MKYSHVSWSNSMQFINDGTRLGRIEAFSPVVLRSVQLLGAEVVRSLETTETGLEDGPAASITNPPATGAPFTLGSPASFAIKGILFLTMFASIFAKV